MKTAFLLIVLIYTLSAPAQEITGTVRDSSMNVNLANASVSILNSKDSLLKKFAWVDTTGIFRIKNLQAGRYIILIEYPHYASFVQTLLFDSSQFNLDLGILNLLPKAKLLQAVIIKSKIAAIRLKGDTTEYRTQALVIQPNDKVEDLLKQLPGMQVDKEGRITVDGQAVTRVLVDGEEFFSDDPTLVTRNIRADMVDKVQVFDQKSKQAAITGVDDGSKNKALNVILKEDKNTGVFGKINASMGTDGYYEGQEIYNKFSKKEKYSLYATTANTGQTGIDQSQENSLGADNNVTIGEGGIIYITGGLDELGTYDGQYGGNGQPFAKSGGVHYDHKWNNDYQSINLNYRIGSIDVKGETNSTTQLSLDSGYLLTNTNQHFDNYAFRQKLDAVYTTKISPTLDLQVGAVGILKNFTTVQQYHSITQNEQRILNTNDQTNHSEGSQQIFNANALLIKKFKRPQNTFTWNLSESFNNLTVNNYLNAATQFFDQNGGVDSNQTVHQYTTALVKSFLLNSNMVYSEPIGKSTVILLNYSFGLYNNVANRETFNQSTSGVYDQIDNRFSNDYQFNQTANQMGALVNWKSRQSNLTIGSQVAYMTFGQHDLFLKSTMNRAFTFLFPQLNYTHTFSPRSTVTFRYNGTPNQPTIEQIQPIQNNTDPLNILQGNPTLDPAYTHRIDATYRNYQVVKNRSIYIGGGLSVITNPITTNTITNSFTGKSIIQYINSPGQNTYTYNVGMNYNKAVKSNNLSLFNYLYSFGTIYSIYNNSVPNRVSAITFGESLTAQENKERKYSFRIGLGPKYTVNQFSLEPTYNNNAVGYQTFASALVYFWKKGQLSSDLVYNHNGATKLFVAQNQAIWNASVGRTFFKNDNLKISIVASDLLNQNVQLSRTAKGNSIFQSNSSGVRRHFMLSASWDFTKFNKIVSKS